MKVTKSEFLSTSPLLLKSDGTRRKRCMMSLVLFAQIQNNSIQFRYNHAMAHLCGFSSSQALTILLLPIKLNVLWSYIYMFCINPSCLAVLGSSPCFLLIRYVVVFSKCLFTFFSTESDLLA